MKVREQLKCPQCRKRVEVDMDSLKVLGDDFAVLQLQCSTCDAYVMLYATIATKGEAAGEITLGVDPEAIPEELGTENVSTKLMTDADEITKLRSSLQAAKGSFTEIFGEVSI